MQLKLKQSKFKAVWYLLSALLVLQNCSPSVKDYLLNMPSLLIGHCIPMTCRCWERTYNIPLTHSDFNTLQYCNDLWRLWNWLLISVRSKNTTHPAATTKPALIVISVTQIPYLGLLNNLQCFVAKQYFVMAFISLLSKINWSLLGMDCSVTP